MLEDLDLCAVEFGVDAFRLLTSGAGLEVVVVVMAVAVAVAVAVAEEVVAVVEGNGVEDDVTGFDVCVGEVGLVGVEPLASLLLRCPSHKPLTRVK